MTKALAGLGLSVIAALGLLYVIVPALAGLDETWRRMGDGAPLWLLAALAFELLSYAGYLVVLRGVLDRHGMRLSSGEAAEITFAGVAATRLLAAGGAGGIALTAWALRRSGMQAGAVAVALSEFFVLLYGVYMATLVVAGAGLALGLLPGANPPALTLVPAAFGGAAILTALALSSVRGRPRRALEAHPLVRRLAIAPAAFGAGVRGAMRMVRGRDPRLAGAPAWWAFDIAVLWASFHAFGQPPAPAVLVMAYFVGMLANLLPLPGGVGGVDGGMIGALVGFGVTAGLAIVAVLTYRAIAFWLPTIPGGFAYVRLRRRLREPMAVVR